MLKEKNLRYKVDVNTGGCCLICLRRNVDPESGKCLDWSSLDGSVISGLLFYLKLNVDGIRRANEYNSASGTSAVVTAQLCPNCDNLMGKVSKLVGVIEKAEMEIAYHLKSIHQNIYESGRTPSKMLRYHRIMKSETSGVSALSKVDNLRKGLLSTCSEMISKRTPKVLISRIDPQLVQLCSKRNTGVQQQPSTSQVKLEPRIPAPPKCHICKKIFIRRLNLNLHLRTVHRPTRISSPKKLSTHIKQESYLNVSKYKSDIYTKKFIQLRNNRGHTGRRHKCSFLGCFKEYRNKKNLEVHRETEHGPVQIYRKYNGKQGKQLTCDICLATFSQVGTMRRHRNSVHLKMNTYECNICRKVYTRNENLKHHYLVVHCGKENQFTCSKDNCGKIFRRKDNLRRHEKDAHGHATPSAMEETEWKMQING